MNSDAKPAITKQFADPLGFHFQINDLGYSEDQRERAIAAMWEVFIKAKVHPFDAAIAAHAMDIYDPESEYPESFVDWTNLWYAAMEVVQNILKPNPETHGGVDYELVHPEDWAKKVRYPADGIQTPFEGLPG